MNEAEDPGPEQSVPDQPVPDQHGPEGPDQPLREPSAAGEVDTLLPSDERDKAQLRIQHAVASFVDDPRSAVEEAASAVDALAERVMETLGQRRGTLRASWQDASGGAATEDQRMALRAYRRLAERLLSL